MSLYWLLPRFRPVAWIDEAIDHAVQWMGTSLTDSVRDTAFEYWLLDPKGQTTTLFGVLMVVALIWIMALDFSSRHHRAALKVAVSTPLGEQQVADGENFDSPIVIQSESEDDTSSSSTTSASVLKDIATPRPRPDNVNLVPAPIRDRRSMVTPTRRQAHPSFAEQAAASGNPTFSFSSSKEDPFTPVAGPSSPRAQTPTTPLPRRLPEISTPDNLDLYSSLSDDEHVAEVMGRNYSSLKKSSPTGFASNVQLGYLNEDGTPTKKYGEFRRLQRIEEKREKGKQVT